MKKKKKGLLTTLAARVTATVSVSLVLLLLAVAATFGIGAHHLIERVSSEVGYVVIMSPDATVSQINSIKQSVGHRTATASYTYSSPRQIEERWNAMTGADSAERAMLASLETSPFQPEFDVRVKPGWMTAQSLKSEMNVISALEGVETVDARSSVTEDVSHTSSRIIVVLLVAATVLLIISFMLINNTVRLSVYSRRFIINTMSLVGATDGYIRRPFILSAMSIGLIAGAIADLITAGILLYLPSLDADIATLITWPEMSLVLIGLPLIGMAVCSFAAYLATNKYLGRSYDSLFE